MAIDRTIHKIIPIIIAAAARWRHSYLSWRRGSGALPFSLSSPRRGSGQFSTAMDISAQD
jgi:hypothetical protein